MSGGQEMREGAGPRLGRGAGFCLSDKAYCVAFAG